MARVCWRYHASIRGEVATPLLGRHGKFDMAILDKVMRQERLHPEGITAKVKLGYTASLAVSRIPLHGVAA